MRYHVLTRSPNLPKEFDDENFDFYGRILNGEPQQRPRWKRCSTASTPRSARRSARSTSTNTSPATARPNAPDGPRYRGRDGPRHRPDRVDVAANKARAKEKLPASPTKSATLTSGGTTPSSTSSPMMRWAIRAAEAFENDRELNKIGKPVDQHEWRMSPPEVNAYYNTSMNDINFPAGILQPPFYDPTQDDAVNYGHIGAIIGHELTHGFDDGAGSLTPRAT